MPDNFLFGIPLRSKAASRDWNQICGLLSSTLQSVLNQTDKDFKVVIACHDAPEIPEVEDRRVEVLYATFPTPTTWQEQMKDKARKRRMMQAHLRGLGGGFLMPVDADDLISQRIVAHVKNSEPRHGFVFHNGFEMDYATKKIRVAPRFYRSCGTCAIIRFNPDDLPLSESDGNQTYSDLFQSHDLWPSVAASHNRALDPMPFPAAMWVLQTGENWTILSGHRGWKRAIFRSLVPLRTASAAEVAEFSIPT